MRRFIVRVQLTTWKITLNASDSRSFWFVNSVKCQMVRGMFASSKTFGAVISRVNDMVFLIFIPRHGKLILFSVGLTPFTKSTNAHLLCWLEKDTCTKPLRLCTFWKLDFTIFLLRNYVNLRHNLSLHLEEFVHWLWNLTTMPPDFFYRGMIQPFKTYLFLSIAILISLSRGKSTKTRKTAPSSLASKDCKYNHQWKVALDITGNCGLR